MRRFIWIAAFALTPMLTACDLDATGIGDAMAASSADCWSSMGCDREPWAGGEPIDYPADTEAAPPAEPSID